MLTDVVPETRHWGGGLNEWLKHAAMLMISELLRGRVSVVVQALLLCGFPTERLKFVLYLYCSVASQPKCSAFKVSCFKARQCVNKCMGTMLQSSPKVLLATWNKYLISRFDLELSWQIDLRGYILPYFPESHLSCSLAALVCVFCGTRHSEHLIILQAVKYKLLSQLTNTLI